MLHYKPKMEKNRDNLFPYPPASNRLAVSKQFTGVGVSFGGLSLTFPRWRRSGRGMRHGAQKRGEAPRAGACGSYGAQSLP